MNEFNIIGEDTRYFKKAAANLSVVLVSYPSYDAVEIVCFDTAKCVEWPRLYLKESALRKKVYPQYNTFSPRMGGDGGGAARNMGNHNMEINVLNEMVGKYVLEHVVLKHEHDGSEMTQHDRHMETTVVGMRSRGDESFVISRPFGLSPCVIHRTLNPGNMRSSEQLRPVHELARTASKSTLTSSGSLSKLVEHPKELQHDQSTPSEPGSPKAPAAATKPAPARVPAPAARLIEEKSPVDAETTGIISRLVASFEALRQSLTLRTPSPRGSGPTTPPESEPKRKRRSLLSRLSLVFGLSSDESEGTAAATDSEAALVRSLVASHAYLGEHVATSDSTKERDAVDAKIEEHRRKEYERIVSGNMQAGTQQGTQPREGYFFRWWKTRTDASVASASHSGQKAKKKAYFAPSGKGQKNDRKVVPVE